MGLFQCIRYFNEIKSENFQEREKARENLGSFSIIPRAYEAVLDKKYGIVLQKLQNGKRARIKRLEKNVIFNGEYCPEPEQVKERILDKYRSIPGFCSMEIGTIDELFENVRMIHEISYSHYAWAKKNNLPEQFPDFCCGSSSRNVFLNLMEKGYPNSSYVSNKRYDHSYVALPFLLGEMKEKGFVVVDPTSDQLFRDKKNAPRNNLFVVFGDTWVYETDWKYGNNLFPSLDDGSIYGNLHTLKNSQDSINFEESGIEEYFKRVFENPVKVKTDGL